MTDTPDPLFGLKRGQCHSCKAEIAWAPTEQGAIMPLDLAPAPDGNVVVEGCVARVLKGMLFEASPGGVPRFKSHFATCPDRKRYRRRK